ncbi:MAG: hypothetical protein KDJ35_09245 [Alphaproteobacteria bacterium]|nr:hypothetical protein [Alphaproteobacteria bacterium]
MSFALKLSPQWLKNIFGSVGISKDPIEDLCYDLADATRGSLGFVRAFIDKSIEADQSPMSREYRSELHTSYLKFNKFLERNYPKGHIFYVKDMDEYFTAFQTHISGANADSNAAPSSDA